MWQRLIQNTNMDNYDSDSTSSTDTDTDIEKDIAAPSTSGTQSSHNLRVYSAVQLLHVENAIILG